MRYRCESGEGKRRRVQKYLGDFERLPTKRSALNAMQLELVSVNKNLMASPQITPTFRDYAWKWIEECEQRKQKPLKPSVSKGRRGILKGHLLRDAGGIGDVPLSEVGNKTMRLLVARLAKKKLAPTTIHNIVRVVKLVKASVVDDEGDELYPTKWNHKFIDMPVVDETKQRKPSFIGEQVAEIVKAASGRMQMAAILFAATGLRAGELFGLEVRHFDGSCVKVEQEVWRSQVLKPKTLNARRDVDLHPDVASLLKTYIGNRSSGFVFQTRQGTPLGQSNVLRREFHPLLDQLGITKRGFHSFRRYRNTYLRNSHCPDGLLKFWMGHANKDMSDRYDRVRDDVQFRRDVALSMGVGFELPKTLTSNPVLGVNGRQAEAVPEEAALAET
jgi:integrase